MATNEDAGRFADKIIERGFATRHLLDVNQGFGEFEFTESGHQLHRHLLHLFDIPNVSPSDLDPDDVLGLISLLLFTKQ